MDPHSKRKIVLIDHDDDFRQALAENLRDDGFEVAEYADPTDPESTTSIEHADVVINDYATESADGLMFAASVHDRRPTLPIVVMVAYPTPQLEARIAATEYVDLLRKPLNYPDLYEWLQKRLVQPTLPKQIG